MSRARRLPSGEVTVDVEEYLSSWYRVVDDLQNVIGGRVAAFDPNLLWRKGEHTWSIPLSLAEAIIEGRKDQKESKV